MIFILYCHCKSSKNKQIIYDNTAEITGFPGEKQYYKV